MRSLLRLSLLAVPGLVLACGSIDDPGEKKPLAVLEGQLTQASTAAAVTIESSSSVRIAVVWQNLDDHSFKSTQDVKAEAVFPSKFRLALTEPPPETAMARKDKRVEPGHENDPPPEPPIADGPSPAPAPAPAMKTLRPQDSFKKWPADFAIAVGSVVAYEDKNGNGKLDLVRNDASAYVDRILGINEDLLLVYTEGTNLPSDVVLPDGSKPKPGFNLLKRVIQNCATTTEARSPGDPVGGDECTPVLDVHWLPMTTLYELPLSAEPRFNEVMCSGDGFGGSGEAESTPGSPGSGSSSSGTGGYGDVPYSGKPLPAPNDPKLSCSPDGKLLFYSEGCTTIDQGPCRGAITTCSQRIEGWGGPTPPAGWPCPVR